MMKNLIFCDIDGTIIDGTRCMIEPSVYTRYAFNELKKDNYIFIASGRCKALLPNWVFDLNPSGYVLCNGSYVEFSRKVIFNEYFDSYSIHRLKDIVNEYNGFYLNETNEKMYVNDFNNEAFKMFVKSWSLDINDNYVKDDNFERNYNISMIGFTDKNKCLEVKNELDGIVNMQIHNRELSCDCNILGIDKGTGVKRAIEYLNISHENTYAFGDALNDLGMLNAVNHPVVMANGSEEIKKYGFALTDDVIEDGIYKYLVNNKLIIAK
ncbi:MAG: HAD-IIB family hydrolase [Erysipelotrichaceae bacterium]|nr:HAD-IIB family hydrolase [Erysipelotrichaceae bacterium]